MVPPQRQTRTNSPALAWLCGANMTPDAGQHGVELAASKRQRLGLGLTPLQLGAPLLGLRPPDLEQLGSQVARHHARASQRWRDVGVARPGRHVEHPLAGAHPQASTRTRPGPPMTSVATVG